MADQITSCKVLIEQPNFLPLKTIETDRVTILGENNQADRVAPCCLSRCPFALSHICLSMEAARQREEGPYEPSKMDATRMRR